MKQWGNKSIEKELKISKKQNKIERYDYLCNGFNAIDYCLNLEKYTKKVQKRNTNLKQAINNIKDKLLCYGETFDSDIHKQFQKECLEIINEVDKDD